VVSTNAAAKGVYSGLGFEEFEQVAYLVADTDSILLPAGADGVETRPYRGADIDEVYNLYLASENPNHLRVFDFSKKKLRTTFWLPLFSFGTSKRIVALRAGRIGGSVVASYTTAKEAGGISSLHVRPEERSQGLEKALLNAAVGEVRKSKARRIVARIPTTRPELVETMKSLGFGEWMVLVGMSKETQW
jgi:GNAT superfamily N-acetyltransferase